MFAVPENTVALPAASAGRHPARIAAEFALDRNPWWHRLRYDPVERFSLLLAHSEDHEAWLLSWLPGQATHPHHHGCESGAFTIVSGVLTEQAMHTDTIRELHPGQSRVFASGYVHRIANDGDDPAVSIHVFRAARGTRRRPGTPMTTGMCEGAGCVEHGSSAVRVDRRVARFGARGSRR